MITLGVEYAGKTSNKPEGLADAALPERRSAIESLKSIGRDVEQAAAPFAGEFGRALREELPFVRAVAVFSDQLDAAHRPLLGALHDLLAKFHEMKSLGSFAENARATEEIYRFAKTCNVDLVYEGRAVSLECLDKKNCKAGLFRLRTLGADREDVYARVDFPPLDLRTSEKTADNQHPESAAAKIDIGRAVSALSEQNRMARGPVVDELRGLLTRLHEAKNLGSYEENARAAEEVYRLAKACGQDLIYEGTPVALQALDKKNYKTGVFKLRTFGRQQKTVYQRVDFPPLDLRTSEKSTDNQHPEPAAAKSDVSRAVTDLSEQFDVVRRPVVDELRGLLTRLHEARNLGSCDENARAAEEVNRIAKSCNVDLLHDGDRVALLFREKKNYKTGLFALRSIDKKYSTVYERVNFPPLDIAPVAD